MPNPLPTLSLICFLYKLKALKQNFFNDAINWILLDLLPFLHKLVACITFSIISAERWSSRWVIFNNAWVSTFFWSFCSTHSPDWREKVGTSRSGMVLRECYQLKIYTEPHPGSMSFSLLKLEVRNRITTAEREEEYQGGGSNIKWWLDGDELRTEDENNKMEHNATRLGEKAKENKNKQEEIEMWGYETKPKNYFLSLLIGSKGILIKVNGGNMQICVPCSRMRCMGTDLPEEKISII